MLIALAAVAAIAAGSLLAPADVRAGHASKNCGVISSGSQDHRVRAAYMKCKQARRASKRYLRTGKPRSGFDCAPTGGGFYCQNANRDPTEAYWATRL